MTLPNFLIVGAQKAGTTSLHDILSQHPQVNMSRVKEINFFTYAKNYKKGLDFYSKFFLPLEDRQKVTGEASPGYMCFPNVANLIKKELGDIKIVMILRDPIKRAFSQYWDNRRHLSETLTEDQIVNRFLSENYYPGTKGYFSRGVYIKYIREYLNIFGRDNLHIMILEDLIHSPEPELINLYHFLEIDKNLGLRTLPKASNSSTIWHNPFYSFLLKNPHYTSYLPVKLRRFFFWGKETEFRYNLPSELLIQKVKNFYKPWNENLEAFLDRKLTHWIR